MSDKQKTAHELWCDIAGALDMWAWQSSSRPTPCRAQREIGDLIIQIGPQAALDALQELAEEIEEGAVDDKLKTCESCVSWTKPKETTSSSSRICPWYSICRGILCEVDDGTGDLRTFESFSCGKYEARPAGPFSVIPVARNKRPMLLFGPTQEHRPVSVMIPEQLAEWLNLLWAAREGGDE